MAVALLGIFLGAALELLAVGVRSARRSGEITQGVLLARRKLDELGLQLQAGASKGEGVGGYRWTAQVVSATGGLQGAGQSGDSGGDQPGGLYQLRVRIAWPGGDRRLELTTLGVVYAEAMQAAALAPTSPGQGITPGLTGTGRDSGMGQMQKGQTGARGTLR